MEEFVAQRVGQRLGERWLLQSVLGVGGMAAVYAATDSAGTEVAVKVLHPEIGMRPEIRDRFMREGYIANRIDHPGAVRVLEHGAIDEWSVFLVMERLQGESLGQRVARQGTLAPPELLDILDQVLDVLAVAHDSGIVHRDLKPDNLFVTSSGAMKVLDFGIARVMESAPDDIRTRTGMAMGTLPFMAPEQALGKRSEIDGRVDIFAMGATAFRILARRRVHEADSDAGLLIAMASKPAPPLRSVAADVPENLAAIIDLALAFDRNARYPDVRTMQSDVRAVRRGEFPAFALGHLRARQESTRIGTQVALPAAPLPAASRVSAPQQPAPPPISHQPTVVAPPQAPQAPTIVAAPPLSRQPTVAAPPHVLEAPTKIASAQISPQPIVSATLISVSHASHAQAAKPENPRSAKTAALVAGSALLIGCIAWALWPASEPDPAEPSSVEQEEQASAEERIARSDDSEAKTQEHIREQSKKQQEKARERQKKNAERQRERDKRK